MLHTLNIYIARSNLVSLSSLDAHLMGPVQVRIEDFFPMVVLYLVLYTSPSISLFFETRHECHSSFFFFSGGAALICNHISWTQIDGRVRE